MSDSTLSAAPQFGQRELFAVACRLAQVAATGRQFRKFTTGSGAASAKRELAELLIRRQRRDANRKPRRHSATNEEVGR